MLVLALGSRSTLLTRTSKVFGDNKLKSTILVLLCLDVDQASKQLIQIRTEVVHLTNLALDSVGLSVLNNGSQGVF